MVVLQEEGGEGGVVALQGEGGEGRGAPTHLTGPAEEAAHWAGPGGGSRSDPSFHVRGGSFAVPACVPVSCL